MEVVTGGGTKWGYSTGEGRQMGVLEGMINDFNSGRYTREEVVRMKGVFG